MKTQTSTNKRNRLEAGVALAIALLGAVVGGIATGCGTGGEQKQDFFTSGSREADQRASQRMAKAEQLAGTGEGAGETGVKTTTTPDGKEVPKAEAKQALYDRLGGEQGVSAIVDDFLPRVIHDPRVNWERRGRKRAGGLFGRDESAEWNPTAENVARLKKHMVQFIALASGGPPQYDGKDMTAVHDGMGITNPEFDAAIGDLKASLDKLQIPNQEQKELLSIIESTRPQIVTER